MASWYDTVINYVTVVDATIWNPMVSYLRSHASDHKSGGTQPIKLDELAAPTDVTTLDVSIAAHGLCPKLPNDINKFLAGDGTWQTVSVTADVNGPSSAVDGNVTVFDGITGKKIKDGLVALSNLVLTSDSRLSDARTPTAHASTHKSGQSDAIKLDELAAPDDSTTLDATTSLHGLLLKAVAPAAGLLSTVGIGNGETSYALKPLFDTTNPEMNGSAAPGSQVIAARRDHVHASDTSRAPVDSPTFTGTPAAPTAPNGTQTTQIATTEFVQNAIAYLDPLLYKGVIDCSGNPNYPAADAGYTYIISVTGKIGGSSGKTATVGDMIICNHDGTPSGDEAAVGSYWNLITVNTGAVIGPASSTDGNFVQWDGATGKLVKNGPAFETDPTNIKMNGTQALGSSGHLPDAAHVHPTDTSRAPATAIGSWASYSPTVTWPGGIAPTITSEVYRFVRNGDAVHVSGYIVYSNGNDAGSPTLSLPVATAQQAGFKQRLASQKRYTTSGGSTAPSDPFAYVDLTLATPLINFEQFSILPSGSYGFISFNGTYEVS